MTNVQIPLYEQSCLPVNSSSRSSTVLELKSAPTFHWKSEEESVKNHFCGHGFIVPSGVLKINPSRLRPCARTLVVMLPFLYEAMPAFMYICGIVSFSLSFKVTLGIFTFFDALEDVVVASVEVLADDLGAVEDVGGDADGIVTGG